MPHLTPSRQINVLRAGDPLERSEIESLAHVKRRSTLPSHSLKHPRYVRQNEEQSDTHAGYNASGRPQQGCPLSCGRYEYESLLESRMIRLLEIEPDGIEIRTLSCRLKVFKLESAPAYEALSYSWSGPRNCFLECNGRPLQVRRNLMSILTRLRLPDSPRYIWADAVCINQRNKDEISSQMTLMREIYQRATRVNVWLGEDTDGKAEEAFERIQFIVSPGNHVALGKSWWSSIAAFYGCRWFSRLWVFQEIAMASSADVLWGDTSISWELVSRATAVIRTLCYRELAQTPIPNFDNAYLFHQWSKVKQESGHPQETFLYMLQVTRKLQCKMPKDRVYGLLGFRVLGANPDKGDLFLEPDTRRSTWSVYRRVARKTLRQMQNLDVLSAVQHKSKIHRPTWVPRWNTWSVYSLTPLGIAAERYAASRHLPAPLLRWAGPKGEILRVSGIEFDDVIKITPKIPDSIHSYEQTTALRDIIAGLLNSVCPYPTGELYDLIACWTLTAGKDWYGMIVQNVPEHLADFATFWAQNRVHTEQFVSIPRGARLGDAIRFATAAGNASGGRRLFHTSKGYMGIGPATIRLGDKVCVLSGGATPFILRHTPHAKISSRRFLLIGEAYVHGIMQGTSPPHQNGQCKLQGFQIV